uniref:Uncharacterized protein n=1 Tax=Cacopsylla melanoneura TaxID=428564 RepID=A0A8D8ZGJ3_9HEMI
MIGSIIHICIRVAIACFNHQRLILSFGGSKNKMFTEASLGEKFICSAYNTMNGAANAMIKRISCLLILTIRITLISSLYTARLCRNMCNMLRKLCSLSSKLNCSSSRGIAIASLTRASQEKQRKEI